MKGHENIASRADARVSTYAGQKRNVKVSPPSEWVTEVFAPEETSLSRNCSQPRRRAGACAAEPDQPPRASGPLNVAKFASCRTWRRATPGPFEKVISKSPPLENRTSTSPINEVFGLL